MQLVHIEHTTADTDTRRLQQLLQARARAAEACVAANDMAKLVKGDLVQHLARRLREGADAADLRKTLQDGGIAPGPTTDLLKAASHA